MKPELSIVMPCLNEAETLAICIEKAQNFLNRENIVGEILIADNGSTDGSQKIAKNLNATVINVDSKGYGSALRGGIEAANGDYVIMGDADDSYDFSNLMPYLSKLREGFDLVMGNRFKGGIEKGAMPFLHKYLGNPVLSFIGRLFFKTNIGDFHCGLRGFSKEAYYKMELKTTGMEFASEMIVKASLINLKIAEVPTVLSKDGRSRPPHLNTWRDGWRHLRFLVLYSPNWLFLIPGMLLMLFGLIAFLLLGCASRQTEVQSIDSSMPKTASLPIFIRYCSLPDCFLLGSSLFYFTGSQKFSLLKTNCFQNQKNMTLFSNLLIWNEVLLQVYYW